MISLVRVDDRLLHGQIICAWVPYVKADALVIASDEAAADSVAREVMSSCAYKGLRVDVDTIEEVVRDAASGKTNGARVILIVGGLKDAMRVYEDGVKFSTLNIGNIHHNGDGGRAIAPSVIIDGDDERLIERFISMGVIIDIRDVPASSPVKYVTGKRKDAQ